MPITKGHKSALMSGIIVAMGASMLAGCAADPITTPKSETYTRDFIKTFGTFDQSHDWNHATQAKVNVTTATATDIKIYAIVDNVRYLFGTYLGVNGQRTLSVDIPKGTTDLIVRANGTDYNVTPGGTLSLTDRSRAIFGSETETTTSDKLSWKIAPEKVFSSVAVQDYIATYHEDDPTNLSKGTNSFYFEADGKEHTFYPFYWYTSAYHVLGIYVVDEEDPSYISMHDLYFSKSGELTYSTDYNPETKEGSWSRAAAQPAYTAAEGTYIKTRGITYQLPKGTRYGFYIKVNNGSAFTENDSYDFTKGNVTNYNFIVFSNGERNSRPYYSNGEVKNNTIYSTPWTECSFWDESGANDLDKFSYASWGTAKMDGIQYRLFGFEDWAAENNNKACDLNDIMFLFDNETGAPSHVIDTEDLARSFEWIIACEDLGTDDFDFNDVVFGVGNKVVAPDGTTTCDITPLAAGGTLPVYLYYDNKPIIPEGTNTGEFHSWFGQNSTNQIINARTYNKANLVHKLEVKSDFTLSCCKTVTDEGDSGNMGGFKVMVKHTNGDEVLSATNPNIAAQIGQAPQMICVPGTWLWPVENRIITDVYAQFSDWCSDMNNHIEWHQNPLGSPVSHYVDRVVTSSTPSTGGSVSGIGDFSAAKDESGAKPNFLKGELITEHGFGSGMQAVYRYTIDPNKLEKAVSIKISFAPAGTTNCEMTRKNQWKKYGNVYNTCTIEISDTGIGDGKNTISDLKDDGCFDLIFWGDNINMTVTAEITYSTQE